MAWDLDPCGSWGIAYCSAQSEMATVLALPGSWPMGEQLSAFVRNDQWANIPHFPAAVTGYTPNPFVMPGSGTITGTGLLAVSTVMFADQNLDTTYQCTITAHTDTSISIQQTQTHLPNMYLYLVDAGYVQVADMIPINTA